MKVLRLVEYMLMSIGTPRRTIETSNQEYCNNHKNTFYRAGENTKVYLAWTGASGRVLHREGLYHGPV